MFRSGTTLLGRMLNAHPYITIASDPYLPFFKMFRTKIAENLGMAIPVEQPLNDYYFSQDQVQLFKQIQQASFNLPFVTSDLDMLRKSIRSYGEPYSPNIMPHLEQIKGDTYLK